MFTFKNISQGEKANHMNHLKLYFSCFIVFRLTTDIQDFKSAFKQIVSQGLRSVTQVIGGGLTLYTLSPKLTYLMLLVLPGVIMV